MSRQMQPRDLFFCLSTLLIGAAYGYPHVSWRDPYWMGDGGGVTLTLTGVDFSEDQFNRFDPKLGNRVTLVNQVDSIDCKVVQYLTNSKKIICVTGKRTMKDGPRVYSIKVFVDGQEATGDHTVEYAEWRSPKIQSSSPRVGKPGAVVNIDGWFHTDKYRRMNTSDPANSNDDKPAITRLLMANKDCDPIDPLTGDFYEPLTTRRVVCRVTSTLIGPMNFTVLVDNYGSSLLPSWMLLVNSKNVLYTFHTYAELTSVSPRVSNPAGGALITVKGNAFDPAPGKTRVTIGGAECVITEIDDYSLKCLAPPQAATGPASGGRGVLYETWEGEYFDNLSDEASWEALTPSHPSYSYSIKNSTTFEHPLSSPSSTKLSAVLHLPHKGNFTIGIHLDGSALLYLGLDGTKDSLVKQDFWKSFESTQGKEIYVEIRTHGETPSKIDLFLFDYNTTFNNRDCSIAKNELQRLYVHPKKYDEVQIISVSGNPGNQKFFINGFVSDAVDMSHPVAVRGALLDLLSFQCMVQGVSPDYAVKTDYEESDEVLKGQRGELVYHIEPFCGRSSLKLLQHYATLYDDSNDNMIDLKTHPFACFAIQGFLQPELEVRYEWKEKSGKTHHHSFSIEHNITSIEDRWTYTCLDLLAMAETTWMVSLWNPKASLFLDKIRLYPKSERTEVFVDSLSFTRDPITVVQQRPSAFKPNGILLKDVLVEQVEGSTDLEVTFLTANCMNDYPLLQVDDNTGSEMVNISRTQAASGVPGGTWSLNIAGEKNISGLSPAITQYELQDLIEAATGISGMTVKRRNLCYNYHWDVEWTTSPGDKELSTVDVSKIINDGPKVSGWVHPMQNGHVAHHPIAPDFFSQYSDEPQVVVSVNDYIAACHTDCDFAYTGTSTASLSSLSTAVAGNGEHTFTITGSGFDSSTLDDYLVFVGDYTCSVTAVSSTTITCIVAYLPAGTYSVQVLVQPEGEVTPRLSHTVSLALNTISPATGGTGGGFSVTVSGTGFPVDLEGWLGNTVTLGDAECVVKGADAVSVTCVAPAASPGSVAVVVSVGGKTASLPTGFTYDDALSGLITGVTPDSSSVLGGSEVVLSGTNFGNGSSGSVKIGSSPCNVTSWTGTEIRCRLPANPAGPQAVEVRTGKNGLARGTFSINYNLRITASSPPSGSLNGGTTMVIEGEGFGTNCSRLEVKLGSSMKCDVTECTETSITCVTSPLRKKHVVSNMGLHPKHGKGFAWYPKRLSIQEGDSVLWKWQSKDDLSQAGYNVFSTSSAASYVYDGKGFNSGAPSTSGSLLVAFPKVGEYTYASSKVIEEYAMSGVIEVEPPAEEALDVQVYLGGFAASVEPDGSNPTIPSDSCTLLDTDVSDCSSNAPTPTALSFFRDFCRTPVVTGITASATETLDGLGGITVRAGTQLTLSGSGFGASECQTVVLVGGASCSVSASSDTSVSCTLDSQEGLLSLLPQDLSVTVANRGTATIDVSDYESQGRISIVPVITSFSPTQGSLAGGTLITITGSGLLSGDGLANVMLGSSACKVQNVSESEITCISAPAAAGSVNLAVTISSFLIPPINELPSQIFMYSGSATPTVTNIDVSGPTFTITGTSFGSDASAITVTLSVDASRRKRSIELEDFEAIAVEEPVFEPQGAVHQEDDIVWDKDAKGPRSSYKPKIRSELFDDLREKNSFWGDFTGTSSRSFIDTVAKGVWRQGGSKFRAEVALEDDVEVPSRSTRDTSDPVTYTCAISSVSDTSVVCDASHIPSGPYTVNVNVEGSGDASIGSGDDSVTLSPTVTSISPVEGSVNGGTLLTITGVGFEEDASVTLGGNTCEVANVSATSITCLVQANAAGSVSLVVTSGGASSNGPDFTFSTVKSPQIASVDPNTLVSSGATLTLSGSNLILTSSEVFVDGAPCPVVSSSDTVVECTAPDLAGGSHDVVVHDNTYGDSNAVAVTYAFTISGISPNTAGFGGVEATISGTGFDPDGTSSVTICDNPCEVISGSYSSLKCVVPSTTSGGSSTKSCDLVVTLADDTSKTLADAFTYDDSLTPEVTSISPTRGGTAGGTTLTITGTGFASSGNLVSIGGSPCNVSSESETEIVCVTEPHNGPGTFSVYVTVPDKGTAVTDSSEDFFYIDRWSSVFTWGGNPPPVEGEYVHIDEGQTVLIDESTPVLKMLLITGGHIVFDRNAPKEVVLRSEYILILRGGSLSIGSEDEPFENQAVIELHGNPQSIELPMYGSKVLAVRNGTLDLHGKPVPVTWTHLASTAAAGSSVITLKQPVTWKAGDRIVIASTERRFFDNENEECTIASVSSDGRQLTLTEPLEYEHVSLEQTLGGRTIETRAEVGLLTRNVKVRGAVNVDFVEDIQACEGDWHPDQFQVQSCFNGKFGEETGSLQFGATVMIFGKFPDQDLVAGRISYVEVTEAGQAFQLGRYPLHFHLVGNVNTSYIRGCAVHRTYNRAVTIHAANNLTVEHNVVYNIMGHAIFTEDGVEQFNTIQYNLAVFTRSSSSLLNVDVTPAAYWVVNPNNIVRHNAAAGGTHFGYWYRLEKHPTGPSSTTSFCPINAPMGEFRNNTAHSMGRYGLWVFSMDGFFPMTGTCQGTDLVAEFYDFTVWRTDRGAEVVLGGALQFHNFNALDNENAGLEMVEVSGRFGSEEGPGIFDSLVVGHSALSPDGCSGSGIIAPKKKIFSMSGVTFVNFDGDSCAALSGCSQCKLKQGGYQVLVQGLNFVNSPNRLMFKWQHETIWIDADGSLSGEAENVVIPTMGILPPSSCSFNVSEFSVNPEAPGSVCRSPIKFHRLTVNGLTATPTSLQGVDLVLSNEHGQVAIPYRHKRLTVEGWMGIVYSGGNFKYSFAGVEQVSNISYQSKHQFLESENYVLVTHDLMQTPDGFGTLRDVNQTALSALPDSSSLHGDYYFDNDTNRITYIVKEDMRSSRSVLMEDRRIGATREIDFQVYRCQHEGCVAPTPPTVPTGRPNQTFPWSDPETWKEVPVGSGGHPNESTYGLPVEGNDIIIPPGMWMVVDTDTPPLGKVFVYGGLEFDDTMDHVFEATHIFLQEGSMVAGFSEAKPFTHNLRILLRGTLDPNDPDNVDMPLPNGGLNVGWKAIGVFGHLLLHGVDVGAAWVKLGATAEPGATDVTLAESVSSDWIGKEVVLTPTGRNVTSEIRTVTGVSSDGLTLTLDAALGDQHLGETYSTSAGMTYTMAGEVGLLTRNVVIEGKDYAELANDSFGGRVLVSSFTQEGITYKGTAKLSNVEFKNMGQENWIDAYDPRYALAFHGLGAADEDYVKKCSFNKNFNSALGLFAVDDLLVEENVIYHTVGSSIVVEGTANIIRRNLIATMLFPGTYNRKQDEENSNWYAALYIINADEPLIEDNVIAGAEQAGVRTYGEDCTLGSTSTWKDNEAHSVLYGVMAWQPNMRSDDRKCTMVGGMYAWRVFETAFFFQTGASVLLTNVKSVDNKLGTNQLIYAPPALAHEFEEKTATTRDSFFVGVSPSHSCDYHRLRSDIEVFYAENLWNNKGKSKGNSGILFPGFSSTHNMAPTHPFHEMSSYPALRGTSYITNVSFSGFINNACGSHVALSTNVDAEDATHPIFVSQLSFSDTPASNMVYMHKPQLSSVNPSDCVDMDCDGLKKVLVNDEDGSLTGTPGATLTAVAEFEWDQDHRRGVGDYRIPSSLRMNRNGSQIDAAQKFPNKGIVRDDSCVYKNKWRAWQCTTLKHRMMVIESMDSDTEIRRLSPIALIANPGTKGYVDLLNGPMDRGWCFGYTCQERISTFYSIVASNTWYEMAFTSTPPQVLRFHLLHADPSESVLLRIFLPKTQRFDVYVDDEFVPPTNIDNSKYPESYQLIPEDPDDPEKFFPSIGDAAGTNYLQREDKFLHVVLRGGHLTVIKTTPTVILSIGLVVNEANFFENARDNIAYLFGIDPANIRVTNVIREDSNIGRRRRSSETVQVEVEVARGPTKRVNETVGEEEVLTGGDDLTYEKLLEVETELVDCFQTDSCSDTNFTLVRLEISDPIPPPEVPGLPATQEFGSQVGDDLYSNTKQEQDLATLNKTITAITYSKPATSEMVNVMSSIGKIYTPFLISPAIQILDANENPLQGVGHRSDPWLMQASLSGGDPRAVLVGNSTVPFIDGVANFTDLSISKIGSGYTLNFSIVHPDSAPQLPLSLGYEFSMEETVLDAEFAEIPNVIASGTTFSLGVSVVFPTTRQAVDATVLEDYLLKGKIYRPGRGGIRGPRHVSVDGGKAGLFNFDRLRLKGTGSCILRVKLESSPTGYAITKEVDMPITVLRSSFKMPDNSSAIVMEMTLVKGTKKLIGKRPQRVKARLVDTFVGLLKTDTWYNSITFDISKKNPPVTVEVEGSAEALANFKTELCAVMETGGLRHKYRGRKYVYRYPTIDGNDMCT